MYLVDKNLGEPVALRAPLKKYDPHSLTDLLAWAATQPAARQYDFLSCENCLVGAYLREACGVKNPGGYMTYSSLFPSRDGYGEICARGERTFGAALSRARSFLQANACERLP